MKNRVFCLALIILLSISQSFGQREKNNIYLFDCTGSMKTNHLWGPAKSALDATIANQTAIPGSQFCIIPFGDKPYEYITFDSNHYQDKKPDIEKAFDKYVGQAKYTRISDVLKAEFQKVDPKKENKIYLLTDGMPNGGDSSQKVVNTINEWCANHHNCRLFYVALTNGVIDPAIKEAIDACNDAFIVQCENMVIPQITDISSHIYTNLQELRSPKELLFSLPGKINLIEESNDPLFGVNVVGNSSNNGKIFLTLTNKKSIEQLHQILHGDEYTFQTSLQCKDKRYFIANPIVTIHVSDRIPSKLSLAQGVDELVSEGYKWYDSFLWSDAAPDKKIRWDLTPKFKNELQDSYLDLIFHQDKDQSTDFQAWYNGHSIKNGDAIHIEPNKPAIIEVQFDHNASTGKRYFSLTPSAYEGINLINEQPGENYKGTSLRTEYQIGWNPLKIFLFWLAIVILAALILWLAVLKRVFFPPIKMARMTITGPGTYYASKKIKGARKVILTSKRRYQNIISRIFTGEVRFIKSECFSPELSITQVGGKKKVKLHSEGKSDNNWDIYPSSIFSQYDKGSITHRTSKEKSEIEFN